MSGRPDTILEQTIASGIPDQGNICNKTKGCVGVVVKEFIGMFRGTKRYDDAKCNRCGEKYPFATHVQKIGG